MTDRKWHRDFLQILTKVFFRLLVLITRIGHQISDDSFKRISACIDQVSYGFFIFKTQSVNACNSLSILFPCAIM